MLLILDELPRRDELGLACEVGTAVSLEIYDYEHNRLPFDMKFQREMIARLPRAGGDAEMTERLVAEWRAKLECDETNLRQLEEKYSERLPKLQSLNEAIIEWGWSRFGPRDRHRPFMDIYDDAVARAPDPPANAMTVKS